MKAQITLTPSESKRLIARALIKHPKIVEALSSGVIVINIGSTNAYVAEELLSKEIEKERFVAGLIDEKGTCVVPSTERLSSIVIKKGKILEDDVESIVKSMGPGDVFIKGANALDRDWTAWVMLASETGGTLGRTLGALRARGVFILIPVGLEKHVPNPLHDASNRMGIYQIDLSTGAPVGLLEVPGDVVTEIEAFKLLGDVEVTLVAGGGIGGGEGSHTFLIEGGDDTVKDIFDRVTEIKGEKNLRSIRGRCSSCIYTCPDRK